MIVTYIGHSGFLAELPHCLLLFDVLASGQEPPTARYDIGRLPELPEEKELLVFVSHAHRDHYSHAIWQLKDLHPRVTYILPTCVPFTAGVRARLGLSEEDCRHVLRVRPEQQYAVPVPGAEPVRIETLRSTDAGVAFWVEAEGQTLFHAGDLHLWLWEEEGPAYMEKMQADFDRFTAPLTGRHADAAFLPLDARLEEHTFDGMDAYLDRMRVSHCFPMHLWKNYDLIPQYLAARAGQHPETLIHRITACGQVFSL